MPLDPSIILAAGNIQGPSQSDVMSAFGFAQQVRQMQRQEQGQNALRQIFSDPNSIDPTTNLPTPKAVQSIMQIDPDMGIKMQDASLEALVRRAQIHHEQTETGATTFNFMGQAAGVGYNAYQDALKAGKPEADAIAAGQAARNAAVQNNGGIIGDDIASGITAKPFDPRGALALARTNKEFVVQQHDAATEDIAGRRLDEADRHDRASEAHANATEAIALASLNRRDDTGWTVLTDPSHKDDKGNPTQYRYNPRTAEATTLDGKPYTPQGASRIGGGGTGAPRSAAAAYIQKYMADNPGATSDDIAKAASRFRLGQSEAGTIGTRAGAADVASTEVDVFAKQALDASNALPRSEVSDVNKVLQAWDTHTSNPQMRQLMIAADALVNARARAISPTGSPHVNDQIEGRQLLSAAFARGDFAAAVQQMQREAEGVRASTQAAINNFDAQQRGSGKPAPSAPAGGITPVRTPDEAARLPKGAHYSRPGDPPGSYRVKQ